MFNQAIIAPGQQEGTAWDGLRVQAMAFGPDLILTDRATNATLRKIPGGAGLAQWMEEVRCSDCGEIEGYRPIGPMFG